MTDTVLALVIVLSAWLGLRWHSGAGFRPLPGLLLDGAIVLWCWAVASLAADRLLLGAIIVAFGAIGLALAGDAKFAALRERLAFSDRAELLEVVRHPHMYLPFVGTGIVVAAVAVLAALLTALEWAETPLFQSRILALLLLIGVGAIYFAHAIPPFLKLLGQLFKTWAPSCVPESDTPRYGLLACFVIHGTLARFERDARRAPYRVPATAAQEEPSPTRSIILVQFESFFDLNRLGGAYGAAAPNLARLQDEAVQFGSLAVPCWGANTIRTEFTVLTGIDVKQIGLDQYNPYERFARAPVGSLAWDMLQRGHHTVCIHPFDLNFYGRARVMPKLGFEKLVGPSEFQRPKRGYVTDQAVVDRIALALRDGQNAGRQSLVFAITVAAHGPWPDSDHGKAAEPRNLGGIGAYLESAKRMDNTLPELQSLAVEHDALLVVYGDHQPSLPKVFGSIRFTDTSTDYVIYDPRNDNASTPADTHRDLAAQDLRSTILRVVERHFVSDPPLVIS